jgi:hypothetical protein
VAPPSTEVTRAPYGGPGADAGCDAADLMHRAEKVVEVGYGPDDRFASAVRHVIRCAADMALVLSDGDLEAAREALGHARAAVGAATYAVRVLHDKPRTG